MHCAVCPFVIWIPLNCWYGFNVNKNTSTNINHIQIQCKIPRALSCLNPNFESCLAVHTGIKLYVCWTLPVFHHFLPPELCYRVKLIALRGNHTKNILLKGHLLHSTLIYMSKSSPWPRKNASITLKLLSISLEPHLSSRFVAKLPPCYFYYDITLDSWTGFRQRLCVYLIWHENKHNGLVIDVLKTCTYSYPKHQYYK